MSQDTEYRFQDLLELVTKAPKLYASPGFSKYVTAPG
jgi:hypothetical protein